MRHVGQALTGLLCALAWATSPALGITFDDGLLHVIDASNSFPFEDVFVRDGPGGATTTVNVLEGADVGSFVDGDLVAFDSSVVNMSSGSAASDLFAQGNSSVNLMGGTVRRTLAVFNSATIVFSGGDVGNVVAADDATLTVTGGSVGSFPDRTGDLQVTDSAVASVLDGVFGRHDDPHAKRSAEYVWRRLPGRSQS